MFLRFLSGIAVIKVTSAPSIDAYLATLAAPPKLIDSLRKFVFKVGDSRDKPAADKK